MLEKIILLLLIIYYLIHYVELYINNIYVLISNYSKNMYDLNGVVIITQLLFVGLYITQIILNIDLGLIGQVFNIISFIFAASLLGIYIIDEGRAKLSTAFILSNNLILFFLKCILKI